MQRKFLPYIIEKNIDSRIKAYLKIKFRRSVRAPISNLRLHRVDSIPIPNVPQEILLFMVVRNETIRLPYLFKYYFSCGVSRIFVVDNGSTDDTVSFLLSQKNTHVFETKERFIRKPIWIDLLLRRYGVGHWCIVVDADELLIYPHWERLSFPDLCVFLDQSGCNTLTCFLLDMYSDKPLRLTSYVSGSNPILTAPYFDSGLYYQKLVMICGGVRKRVFGFEAGLIKMPLIKFDSRMFIEDGTHSIEEASVANVRADIRGALLHFKFFSDFNTRVADEVKRKEHWKGAVEYMQYMRKIDEDPNFSLYYPQSVKFVDTYQLVNLGIMKSSADLDTFAKTIKSK